MPTQNEVSFVAKSSSKSEAEGPDLAQIDNVFKHLTVEEPSEAFLEASSVVAPHKPESHDGPRFVVVAERPETTAEKWSAVHCLLYDVKKIRRSINGFWTRYRVGNITLTAASIATNTATEIIRQKQEDYDAAFPGHAGFENLIKDFYAVQCFHRQRCQTNVSRPVISSALPCMMWLMGYCYLLTHSWPLLARSSCQINCQCTDLGPLANATCLSHEQRNLLETSSTMTSSCFWRLLLGLWLWP